MKKKLLIFGGVFVGVIGLLLILLFTLFALHSVEVDFRTRCSEDFPSQQQIVQAGKFSYQSPILFLKKNSFKKNIESAYPEVEVVNIETVFPNRLVVHVRERIKVFAFVHNGKTYFCDNNLVVLQVEDGEDYKSDQTNPILISGLSLPQEDCNVGDRLQDENYVDFYEQLLACNRKFSEQKSMIESIEFSSHTDHYTNKTGSCLCLHTFAGNDFWILNSDMYLPLKTQRFLVAYSSLYTSYLGKPITDDPDSTYYSQNWTEELLSDATIVIDSVKSTGQSKNVYANVYPKDEVPVLGEI